MCSTV